MCLTKLYHLSYHNSIIRSFYFYFFQNYIEVQSLYIIFLSLDISNKRQVIYIYIYLFIMIKKIKECDNRYI